MALQFMATLGLRTRGFFSALATSQGAWARFGRLAGSKFGGAFAGASGKALGFLAVNKLFGPKPKATGTAGMIEGMTGVNPKDPVGLNHRFKSALIAGGLGAAALGAAGISRARDVKDMSDISDLSTDDAQRVDSIARRNARSFDDVAMALSNMGVARRE